MNVRALFVFGIGALAAAVGMVRFGVAARRPTDSGPAVNVVKSHRATVKMIAASAGATGRPAPPVRAASDDGTFHDLVAINAKWPVVLVFIKDGCPCSKAAEPYFHRLHAAGCGWIPFFGIIDGGEDVAERWVAANATPFPVLADPDRSIIHAYGAESSAYVALLAPGGKIERLWAGYSATMLRELEEGMSRLSGRVLEPIDVDDAPAELYSGCPFE